MAHINTIISETLDPQQLGPTPTDPQMTLSIALHTALSRMDKRNNYVRMLFIDYSSALNTIVPFKLINKLRILGLNICNWKVVRIGNNTSATLMLNTGTNSGVRA